MMVLMCFRFFHDEVLSDILCDPNAVGPLGKLATESEGEVALKMALIRKRRMNRPMARWPPGSVQTAGCVYDDWLT